VFRCVGVFAIYPILGGALGRSSGFLTSTATPRLLRRCRCSGWTLQYRHQLEYPIIHRQLRILKEFIQCTFLATVYKKDWPIGVRQCLTVQWDEEVKPLKWLLCMGFLCVWMVPTLAQSAEADETSVRAPLVLQYKQQSLSIIGSGSVYGIIQGQYQLRSVDFAHMTGQFKVSKWLRQKRTVFVASGIFTATLGVGATLFGAYIGVVGMAFGGVAFGFVGIGVVGLGIGIVYGGIRLGKREVRPHKIWTRAEAEQHIRMYNQSLLQSQNQMQRRPAIQDMRLVFHHRGFALRGLF
jgi:hypothetical protein